MRDPTILQSALITIEEKLCEPLDTARLAEACFCSVSTLQKHFAEVFCCSVYAYIAKRRISRASQELVQSQTSIIDIALGYQYGSPEAFARAFRRVWGLSPSAFRRTHRFADLFPKLLLPKRIGGRDMPTRMVDIASLYDALKALRGTYVLALDIRGLSRVNDEPGYAAGDLFIAEAAKRVDRLLTPDMMLFRIGRDEFAVITGLETLEQAQVLKDAILAHNGERVPLGNETAPLALWVGLATLPQGPLDYREALMALHEAIQETKRQGA